MKTLIYGAGPIGQWLALRLQVAGQDVTLLARNGTYHALERNAIEIVDGLTHERQAARVKLTYRLDPEDRYDLVIVAMQKASRLAVCPILASNRHVKHILFVGNDVWGFHRYLDVLPAKKVLLGFPGVGGGWEGDDLVIMDRDRPGIWRGPIFFGELDGSIRQRTLQIAKLFESVQIKASVQKDMDGWLKYHVAFMAPTAGVIFKKGGDLNAVAADAEAIHQYCQACREAGTVLRKFGYRKRQPPVFNLYYWLPRWLEPRVFARLFASRGAEVRFGLHIKTVGPELIELIEEFVQLKSYTAMDTPALDELLGHVPQPSKTADQEELAS